MRCLFYRNTARAVRVGRGGGRGWVVSRKSERELCGVPNKDIEQQCRLRSLMIR